MNKKGFTLAEAIIVIAILSLIMGMVSSFLVNVQRAHVQEEARTHVRQNASIILNIITDDLRLVGIAPNSQFGVMKAWVDKFEFKSDISPHNANNPDQWGDGAYQAAKEYFYVSARNEGSGAGLYIWRNNGQSYIPEVTAFAFTYYDSLGQVLAVPMDSTQNSTGLAKIKRIDIAMTLKSDKQYGKKYYSYVAPVTTLTLKVKR
jgi:prepilin-type N-terminal cleavage/methylation domain-containing protein